MRTEMELLFNKYDLSNLLESQSVKMKEYVSKLGRDKLLDYDLNKLLIELKMEFLVQNIEMQEQDISVSQKESKIDARYDPDRIIFNRDQPFYIDGIKITYHVPFKGDKTLFQCQPGTFTLNPPLAKVESKELQFIYGCSHDKVQNTKKEFENELEKVKQYAGWVNDQVSQFNQKIDTLLYSEVQSRKNKILESQNQINTLGYKIHTEDSVAPVKVKITNNEKIMARDNVKYDVAFSFAGENRDYVKKVATFLKESDVNVFYDEFEEVNLWGKNLIDHFAEIYSKRSHYVVMFVSKYYAQKAWPNHERQHAQAAAFKGHKEYLLPARFDDTDIPGLPETIAYVDLRKIQAETFGELILKKIRQ